MRGGNDPRLEDVAITSDLMSALGKGATVIYIGHSLGADSALRFAQAARNFKLPLICPVDPVSWDSNAQQAVPGRWEVGSNVARLIGYRTNTFPGGGSGGSHSPPCSTIEPVRTSRLDDQRSLMLLR